MAKKRVLHINWSGTIGGAERALDQLLRSQLSFSHYRPAMAFARAHGYYRDSIESLGCEIVDLGLRSDSELSQIPRISRLMQSYDIHHFHSAEISIMAASFLCRGVKRIFTQRGGITDYKGKQKLRIQIARPLLRRFDGLTGNTHHACDSGARLFAIPRSRWVTVYNGLDFSLLSPVRKRAEVAEEVRVSDQIVIGTSANLREWKRIDLLIKSCAELKDYPFKLLIIGDGPARPGLERLCRDVGLNGEVVFTGLKKHVGDYLQLMDVFVLPSTALESFGNAVVEAMSQGVPGIVLRDSPGIAEHIEDGKSGFVVPNAAELTAKIRVLLDDSQLRKAMGENARARVTSRYTLSHMASLYDELYDSVA